MDLKTQLETVAKNHQASIQNLETKFDRLVDKQSGRPSGSLLSNTQLNPKGHNAKAYQPPQSRNEHVNAVFTRSADLGASINLMPYSLYAKLSLETIKPTKMSVRLADRSFQYPVGIAENMLIDVGKLTFPANFVILKMKEDTMTTDENSDSESETEDLPFERITINTDYKIKTSLEEPPTDLELKPLPDNLEYVFLEEPFFLHKTTDIPGICPSFYKHNIQLLDDKKPVIQKQRRLNPNMQEVVKKEIVKLLDTCDFAVGAVLGQKDGKNFHPIYFASKTLNPAQQKYTVTEKELMAVVFAFDKFRSYLILSKTIVHTDHSALRHIFKKQDAKPRLIRWILLLQEFDIEIKDRKGLKMLPVPNSLYPK
ncbi:reverse transcriptase domain-containing protein [Tanacetum coccineum]